MAVKDDAMVSSLMFLVERCGQGDVRLSRRVCGVLSSLLFCSVWKVHLEALDVVILQLTWGFVISRSVQFHPANVLFQSMKGNSRLRCTFLGRFTAWPLYSPHALNFLLVVRDTHTYFSVLSK